MECRCCNFYNTISSRINNSISHRSSELTFMLPAFELHRSKFNWRERAPQTFHIELRFLELVFRSIIVTRSSIWLNFHILEMYWWCKIFKIGFRENLFLRLLFRCYFNILWITVYYCCTAGPGFFLHKNFIPSCR